MTYPHSLSIASARLAQRVIPFFNETLAYKKANRIATNHGASPTATDSIQIMSFADIVDCGNQRFDFGRPGENSIPGIVLEAHGGDGETIIDLIAWLEDQPEHVMTMFGRCGFLGAFSVTNPASYYMGGALPVFRTPLEFMQAGFIGAVPIVPSAAAQMMFNMPEARFQAQDLEHAEELERLRHGIMPKDQIVVPTISKRRAA